MRRLSTGIEGMDSKMEGGFFEGSVNLVTGKTGTGKTAFSSSFIYEGLINDEPGVYITTEETKEDVIEDIRHMFGWDLSEYEDSMLKVLSLKPLFPTQDIDNLSRLVRGYLSDFMDKLEESVKEVDAERVVVDSVSIIEMFVQNEYMIRVAISSLINELKKMNITTLLVGTIPETSEGLSGGGITEYLVDGVIKLKFVPVADNYNRTLEIRKMRRTDHSVEIFPMKIVDDGLVLIES